MKRPSPPRPPRGSGPTRAAILKAAQRARIEEEHGIEELRRRRREEKRTERLLEIVPRDGPHGRLIVLSRRPRPDSDQIFRRVTAFPKATSSTRVLLRVARGAGFTELSKADRRAFAAFFWARTWFLSVVYGLGRHSPPSFVRPLRRRLLSVAELIRHNPTSAVRRLIRVGLLLPEEVLAEGGSPAAAALAGSLAATVHAYLRNSGVEVLGLDRQLRLVERLSGEYPARESTRPPYLFDFACYAIIADGFGSLLRRASTGRASDNDLVAFLEQRGRELNITPALETVNVDATSAEGPASHE